MKTTVAIVDGMGFFLLGMAIMADGLKALVLAKAAATSMSGTFWGAVVTLLVQSSSADHHDHYRSGQCRVADLSAGIESGGRREHRQDRDGMARGSAVRTSLTDYALPIVFAGALLKLMGKGRWASGAAIADFALILVGLTTLQQGMSELAEQLNRADLPAVLGEPGVPWSSVMAGIGASSRAKRLAVAYVPFKVIAAVAALILVPLVVRLMLRASESVDSVTLVAIYRTACSVMGVAILLPLIGPYVDAIRLLDQRVHHAWRVTAHLAAVA